MWEEDIYYMDIPVRINNWSKTAGLHIEDPKTIEMIIQKDPRIFELLGFIASHHEEIKLVSSYDKHEIYLLEYFDRKNGIKFLSNNEIDELKTILETVVNSSFAEDEIRSDAEEKLEEVLAVIERRKSRIINKDTGLATRRALQKKYAETMLKLASRDGYRCKICKTETDLSIDHIKPIIMGGGNELENLQILCRSHNSQKGDKYNE